jgi:hypothetical protein
MPRKTLRIITMSDLDSEIAAYEDMREDLEAHQLGRWVIVHDRQLVGDYESMESAADDGVRRFGRGPFLLRQVGAPPLTLPVSLFTRR